MSEPLEVRAVLVDDRVRFEAVAGSNPPVVCDFRPPLGTGRGYTGLEVLLMSLAVCSATTLVWLLRETGKTVSHCEVTAAATLKDRPAVGYDSVSLHFALRSPDVQRADVEKALDLARDSACPVWQMVKGHFPVTTGFRMVGTEGTGSPS